MIKRETMLRFVAFCGWVTSLSGFGRFPGYDLRDVHVIP